MAEDGILNTWEPPKNICHWCGGKDDVQLIQMRHGFKTYDDFDTAACAPCRKKHEHRWRWADSSKRKRRRSC